MGGGGFKGRKSSKGCFPHTPENCRSVAFFNSAGRKLLKADPRPTDGALSSSMSTCQQPSCLTGPLLGTLRSGHQTTAEVEQKQTNHQIRKSQPTIGFANGGVDPQHALLQFHFK